jgi:hypothetical protein
MGSSAATSTVDTLVDATPADRDRYVDFLRVASIAVVVSWHWVFSVTHWQHGRLTMPNPIGDVPLLWLLTWVLQVMPVFFFVGGYANSAGWTAAERTGGGPAVFARRRLERLYRPVVTYVGLWAAFDVVARLVHPGYPGVFHYGMVVFVPLWFLGVYTIVTLATPITYELHRRFGPLALVGLGCAIALADVGRLHYGIGWLGLANSMLVFVFAHQLGYLYRDGTLVRIGRRGQAALTLAGGTALVVITAAGVYPHSMVAVRGKSMSNMFPTTACIAVLAVFQVGLAMLLRPVISTRLQRRSTWRAVVAANGIAMTVFVWHMTTLLVVIAAIRVLGFELLDQPTRVWWLTRPFWFIAPGAVLAGLVAVFSRRERSPSR